MERIVCPHCGSANLPTDPVCLDCGEALRAAGTLAHAPDLDAAGAEAEELPKAGSGAPSGNVLARWFDLSTPEGQRRTALVSGCVMGFCVAVLLRPVAPFLLVFVPGLMVWEWLAGARERARDREFDEAVRRGGGDKVALRGALARLHRPDSFVVGPRGSVIPIAGFDSRLESDDDPA